MWLPHRSLGRQPCSEVESEAHLRRLADGLIAAIARDFDEAERALGSLPCLTAKHIVAIARAHLRAAYLYQETLGVWLTLANHEGEERRREERLRIWGYA